MPDARCLTQMTCNLKSETRNPRGQTPDLRLFQYPPSFVPGLNQQSFGPSNFSVAGQIDLPA